VDWEAEVFVNGNPPYFTWRYESVLCRYHFITVKEMSGDRGKGMDPSDMGPRHRKAKRKAIGIWLHPYRDLANVWIEAVHLLLSRMYIQFGY
jgi:hypothetical protein